MEVSHLTRLEIVTLTHVTKEFDQIHSAFAFAASMTNLKKVVKRFSKTPLAKYIKEFGDETTLHGFPYVIKPNFHYLETLLWFVIVILSIVGATSLILNSWNRYNANPTVISLQKNYRDWNLTFPASTVCFLERMNKTLARDFISERWNLDSNSTEFKKYLNFLNAITNLTYYNLDEFKKFTDDSAFTEFKGEEMVQIARRIMVEMVFHSNMFNIAYKDITFQETLTENGLCYSFSGVLTNHISLMEQKEIKNPGQLPKCNYLNSLCYGRVEDLPDIIKYFVHSPFEIPEITDKAFMVFVNMERDTSFRFQEMVASEDLRRLEPRQRQCRFFDEPMDGQVAYSYNLCRMECRKQLSHRFCGCAPHFYLKGGGIPVCDVAGLACLAQYKDKIINHIGKDGKKIDCPCLLQCEYTSFYIDKDGERQWSYPVPRNIRYRWAVEHYSKTRQKREIIFGLEDLLVSLGGTAAFFLGCSVLSFVEIAYFFTLRLFWYILRRLKRKNKTRS